MFPVIILSFAGLGEVISMQHRALSRELLLKDFLNPADFALKKEKILFIYRCSVRKVINH